VVVVLEHFGQPYALGLWEKVWIQQSNLLFATVLVENQGLELLDLAQDEKMSVLGQHVPEISTEKLVAWTGILVSSI